MYLIVIRLVDSVVCAYMVSCRFVSGCLYKVEGTWCQCSASCPLNYWWLSVQGSTQVRGRLMQNNLVQHTAFERVAQAGHAVTTWQRNNSLTHKTWQSGQRCMHRPIGKYSSSAMHGCRHGIMFNPAVCCSRNFIDFWHINIQLCSIINQLVRQHSSSCSHNYIQLSACWRSIIANEETLSDVLSDVYRPWLRCQVKLVSTIIWVNLCTSFPHIMELVEHSVPGIVLKCELVWTHQCWVNRTRMDCCILSQSGLYAISWAK